MTGPIPTHGTVRTRTAQDTWERLAPEVGQRYGISRVARLTGLDYVGLPVYTAIRPAAHTLTATQGKGATDLLARLSAVMEGVELWHAEQPLPVSAVGSYRSIAPPYPLDALPLKVWDAGLERLRLEWTMGTGFLSGRTVLVPADVIRRSSRRPAWQPDILRATSTGLAAGNSSDEAALHALYEVVERDVLHTDDTSGGGRRTVIDPASVTDPYCASLINRLAAARITLEIVHVRNGFGLPVCTAYLTSEDYPVWFAGGGCHTDPGIALSRAITEAAQSRLTCIAGTRDDLPTDQQHFTAPAATVPSGTPAVRTWEELSAGYEPWYGRIADQALAVAGRIQAVTGHEPVIVDLTQPGEAVTTVKVICPATRSRMRRSIPR